MLLVVNSQASLRLVCSTAVGDHPYQIPLLDLLLLFNQRYSEVSFQGTSRNRLRGNVCLDKTSLNYCEQEHQLLRRNKVKFSFANVTFKLFQTKECKHVQKIRTVAQMVCICPFFIFVPSSNTAHIAFNNRLLAGLSLSTVRNVEERKLSFPHG